MDFLIAIGAALTLLVLALLPAFAISAGIAYAAGISFLRAFVMLVCVSFIIKVGRAQKK